MMHTSSFLVFVGCWVLASPALSANPPDTLSMDHAIALALGHHPILNAATHLIEAAGFRLDQLNSQYYPQLFFNTSFTRWDWVLPNKKIFLGNSLNDLYAEFTVQQLLYNGGRTSIQSDLAQTLVDVEGINNQRLQQGIVFSVAKAYLLMLQNKQSDFFKQYREKGIPASKVPATVVDPLIAKVLSAPQEMLLNVSEVFDYTLEPHRDSFNGFVCEECGEMTVEGYGRIKNGKHVCIDCAVNA